MSHDWLCPGTGCLNMVGGRDLCPDCVAYLPRVLHDIGEMYSIACTKDDELALETLIRIRVFAGLLDLRIDVPLSSGRSFEDAHALLSVGWHAWSGEALTNFYNAMSKTRAALAKVANPNTSTQMLDIPCSVCMCATLVQHDIGKYVLCLTCNARWGEAAFQAKLDSSGTPGVWRADRTGIDEAGTVE